MLNFLALVVVFGCAGYGDKMIQVLRETAPVLLANLFTVIFILGWIRIHRWERDGHSEGNSNYRVRDLLMVIGPPLVFLYVLYLNVGYDAFRKATPLKHWLPAEQHQPQRQNQSDAAGS